MRQAGEPSVEEILESIKKVIARDNRAEAAQQRARRESMAPMAEQPAAHQPQARPAKPVDVLELTEAEAQDLAFEGGGTEAGPEVPLVPDTAAASMRDSLAALAMLSSPGAAPQIVRSGETSLEGLAREMLRPMLAEWLERNLPAMVERMVAAEIARIAGKKG